jgi:hypothetical protein
MGEELPSGICQQSIHDIFVAKIVLKLQDVQSNHQPRAGARETCGGGIGWLESALDVSCQVMRTASYTNGYSKPMTEIRSILKESSWRMRLVLAPSNFTQNLRD